MSSAFNRVPDSEWILSDTLDNARRQRLLSGMTFEQIVCVIFGSLQIEKCICEPHSSQAGSRIVVTLKMDASTVDLFHNSASGYRAQYYCGVRKGEKANRYAVTELFSRVMELIAEEPNSPCPELVKKSLRSAQAKLWIHQGTWFRLKRKTDRNLHVLRWVEALDPTDLRQSKKARWGSLTPSEETRIDLKGGFVNLAGTKMAESTKPSRSADIHKFGFT